MDITLPELENRIAELMDMIEESEVKLAAMLEQYRLMVAERAERLHTEPTGGPQSLEIDFGGIKDTG
jgi:hypothetical protein